MSTRKKTPAPAPVASQLVTTPQLLTINQVAALMGVHRTTVYDFISAGELPVMRLGTRSVRIDAADYQQWVEQRKAQEQAS